MKEYDVTPDDGLPVTQPTTVLLSDEDAEQYGLSGGKSVDDPEPGEHPVDIEGSGWQDGEAVSEQTSEQKSADEPSTKKKTASNK